MPLFQKSVLNKYLRAIEPEQTEAAWGIYQAHFLNPAIQENIRNAKEEQYQEGFLDDLFVKVLGYVKAPQPDYNLTTELKNVKGAKKTDGAILKGDKALGVIELKGTSTTDLSKVQDQAFGYKNNQPGCVYVITSNFEKLRFYIDNAVDFLEFNLFTLSREDFDLLWLCLSADSLLRNTPKEIKKSSLTQEDEITKQLYKDYSQFRTEIFDDIRRRNPEHDPLVLFNKTQKLLDRFLFIFFAEDRLLLPPNSIRQIVNQWQDLRDKYDEYFPLYDRFKKYFGYMNTGYKGSKYEVFAYNGGLFEPDELLDSMKMDDALLYKHTTRLSNYDFESEVDVNILGHIFEHSLTEIETIQARLEGEEIDKSKSKRKKDGVFYTPKYITKYIVENTIGRLCEEKRNELGIDEEEYDKERKGRKKATLKHLSGLLETYREWLLDLKICDPACGSGAFLNQALEQLIAEHKYVDELKAKLLGNQLIFSEVENDILERNLYGVDINEESVDIAKFSLWLRTAKKGRKLNSLTNNIKCGNSLIDDSEVAGDKAFNWEHEFPEVFEKGGFDVVIGNPPYGAHFRKEEKNYITTNFESYQYKFESYLYFYEKGIQILKLNGFLSFITPELFLRLQKSENARKYLYKNSTLIELKFLGENVFSDVKVNSVILTLTLGSEERNKEFRIVTETSDSWLYSFERWGLTPLFKIEYEISPNDEKVISKILKNSTDLGSIGESIQGITPYDSYRGQSSELIASRAFHSKEKIDETCEKWLDGKNVNRYQLTEGEEWLRYGDWLAAPRDQNFFHEARLLFREVPGKNRRIQATYAEAPYYHGHSITPFKPNETENTRTIFTILGIVNSKLISWFAKFKLSNFSKKTFPKLNPKDIKQLPIHKEFRLIKLPVEHILEQNKNLLQKSSKFLKRVQDNLGIEKISKKLSRFYDYDFKTFLAELKRKKVKLSLSEQDRWEEYFNQYKSEIQELQAEIDRTDREIDQMVYELYGLTEKEIELVEQEMV